MKRLTTFHSPIPRYDISALLAMMKRGDVYGFTDLTAAGNAFREALCLAHDFEANYVVRVAKAVTTVERTA